MTDAGHGAEELRSYGVEFVLGGVGACLAAVVLGLLLGVDSVTVTSPETTDQVSFGLPLPWLSQDLSPLAPSHPYATGVQLPSDYPTDIHWLRLTVDFTLLWAATTLPLLHVLRRVRRRPRQGPRR